MHVDNTTSETNKFIQFLNTSLSKVQTLLLEVDIVTDVKFVEFEKHSFPIWVNCCSIIVNESKPVLLNALFSIPSKILFFINYTPAISDFYLAV